MFCVHEETQGTDVMLTCLLLLEAKGTREAGFATSSSQPPSLDTLLPPDGLVS